jgi:hypothetical protein
MQCPYCKEEVIDGALKCKHCGSTLNLPPASLSSGGQADFGLLFTTATNLWKGNLGDLVLLTLVFILVVWIPIANIGFIAGYTRALLKVARGGKAQVGDIFNAWDCFVNLLVYLLLALVAAAVLHFVPFVGSLAAMALGFIIVPGMYAIIDARQDAIAAFKWSLATIQADFLNWLLAYLVGTILGSVGAIILFIGIIVTLPWGQLVIIKQYERVKPA